MAVHKSRKTHSLQTVFLHGECVRLNVYLKMLYNILKLLYQITFKYFFRKTFRLHAERLPESGPLVICANHPGAFLDPIVIAASTKRRIYFLAKAAVFKGAFAKWLLPKFNMIPVYRKLDDPAQMHKNDETFAKCYEHLLRGDAILIFPEGISITERKLKEIKTGAARIALGACAASGYKQDVKIECLRINYDDPHIFRQDVLLSYSEPISMLDYKNEHETVSFKAAQKVTDVIRERLESEVIHIEHEEADGMKNRISILIPCHRVIGSDGHLTGYGGGLWRKQYLLELERQNVELPLGNSNPVVDRFNLPK